ncbi:hypothetical protein [Gemmatimonas sp.]
MRCSFSGLAMDHVECRRTACRSSQTSAIAAVYAFYSLVFVGLSQAVGRSPSGRWRVHRRAGGHRAVRHGAAGREDTLRRASFWRQERSARSTERRWLGAIVRAVS